MNVDSSDRKSGFLKRKQVVAWLVLGIFVAGIFVARVGVWTQPILGAWFVGTQRLKRGFLWMLAIAVLFGMPHLSVGIAHTGADGALAYLGWTLAAMVIGILPFTFYRMIGSRLPEFVATLALPLGGVVVAAAARTGLPGNLPTDLASLRVGPLGPYASILLTYWFAAVLLWMWNLEFRTEKIAGGASVFVVVSVASIGLAMSASIPALAAGLVWACAAGATVLGIWTLIVSRQHRGWDCQPETLKILQSPSTSMALTLVRENGRDVLVSSANERFPVRHGICDLRTAEDLTGLNQKYNRLYETIGSFYDDIQRVVCALQRFDRRDYVMSYLGLLEVKPGDAVLETSVGTGLNFKYLPRGTRLCGIDLSPEMLTNCRANLERWQMKGDLFLGNAECLPFADESFDVVFHVGGINFFNERGKAIREMIRVARPGSKILIADETEEHVKATYERGPVTGGYFKNRKEPVTPPVDLVPPEMLETHLEILHVVGKNRFYALTFRKPRQSEAPAGAAAQATSAGCAVR